MSEALTKPCTAFVGHRLLAAGPIIEVALAIKNLPAAGQAESVLAFDDTTGRLVDFDLRGTKAELIDRLMQALPGATPAIELDATPVAAEQPTEKSSRGRPRLGVVAREVTLLPRHWEWLADQPGGASVTLRKLVEDARRNTGAQQKTRQSQDAAYRVMSAMAGDFTGFEEATRALFADDRERFEQQMAEWPQDVRDYVVRLAFGEHSPRH